MKSDWDYTNPPPLTREEKKEIRKRQNREAKIAKEFFARVEYELKHRGRYNI